MLENLIKLSDQLEATNADAARAAEKQQAAAKATEAANKAQQKAAEEAAEAAAKGKEMYTQSLMSKGVDADTVAESVGYTDEGFGFSPMDKALAKYSELMELAKNGTITKDGLAELDKVARIVDYYTKQQEDAARKEEDAAEKRLEAAKKDQETAKRAADLTAKSKMTDEQAGIYDKLHGLLERMADTNLTKKEQQAILGREIAKMIKGTV